MVGALHRLPFSLFDFFLLIGIKKKIKLEEAKRKINQKQEKDRACLGIVFFFFFLLKNNENKDHRCDTKFKHACFLCFSYFSGFQNKKIVLKNSK